MGAKSGDDHGDKATEDVKQVVVSGTGGGVAKVVDGAAGKAKTDDHDYWSDNKRWEKLVKPFDSAEFDDDSDDDVNKTDHGHTDR